MYYDLKKLKNTFDRLSYSKSEFSTFADVLEYVLFPFRYYEDNDVFKTDYEKWQSHPQAKLMMEFLTELGELNPEGFADPLGEFYMMHISHGRLGQYFTPEPITDMMSIMTMPEELKDGQRLLDPACGSGRFILSAAKRNRHVLFYAADLDPICSKMCLLNMLLNSLSGEVATMNSLSNEFFRGYQVKTKLLNGHHYPYFVEFTEPEQSVIWLRPQPAHHPHDAKPAEPAKAQFFQGTLF